MAAINREVSRDALEALLETALVGTELPAQAVYNYQIGDFAGQSPVVTVSSGGSLRSRRTITNTNWDNVFYLNVHVFVLYAEPDNVNWTDAHAEDALDDIERRIADVLMINRSTANWDVINYAGRSNRISIDIGGDEYSTEIIPTQVEKYE